MKMGLDKVERSKALFFNKSCAYFHSSAALIRLGQELRALKKLRWTQELYFWLSGELIQPNDAAVKSYLLGQQDSALLYCVA